MEYLLPCAPKFTVRGWPGVAGCFAAGDSHAEREKGFLQNEWEEKIRLHPGEEETRKTWLRQLKKTPQNPTKVLKPQSSEVLTRDPG